MCKAISLTFSKKNEDVKIKIDNRNKSKYKTATEYICEAIRDFETENNYKNDDVVTRSDIELIIKNAFDDFKHELINNDLNLYLSQSSENDSNSSLEQLEENLELDILNIEED